MVCRIEKSYKVNILCTDGYDAYAKYRFANRHVVTKSETSLVESKNSLIRHYLARFNRRTKRYSKAFDMIENSILLLFNKCLIPSFFV
jgi:insertion element IS1 protein InsB